MNIKKPSLILSVRQLERMIALIKKDRKDNYNGKATCGWFDISENSTVKNMFSFDGCLSEVNIEEENKED